MSLLDGLRVCNGLGRTLSSIKLKHYSARGACYRGNDGTTTYTFTVSYPNTNPTTGQLAFMSAEFGMGQLTWRLT